MILLKTAKEIEIMARGGKKLAWVMGRVLGQIRPGIKLSWLDRLAEKLIKKQGGFPSFKKVKNYHWVTCININEGVVHGIPGDYKLKKEDLVSLDMGMFFQGFHTDMARTIRCGGKDDKFLKIGRIALKKAVERAKPGNRVGHLSLAIQNEIKKADLNPVRVLTGHGIGRKLHEAPRVPCFLKDEIKKTAALKAGMVLAIEVIYSQGSPDLVLAKDGWTLKTADGKLAGLFEDTVAITKSGPKVLTRLNPIILIK